MRYNPNAKIRKDILKHMYFNKAYSAETLSQLILRIA